MRFWGPWSSPLHLKDEVNYLNFLKNHSDLNSIKFLDYSVIFLHNFSYFFKCIYNLDFVTE